MSEILDRDKCSESSDYVLDSDESESTGSLDEYKSDQLVEIQNHEKINSNILNNSRKLYKTCSTGDLRIYHKTMIKKKINTLEMRISTLENDLKQLSQQFETEQLNKQQKLKQSTNSINIINGIKYLGITIILYHISKQIL